MAGERSVGELLDELFGFESVAKRQAALEQYDRGELARKARSRELLGVLRGVEAAEHAARESAVRAVDGYVRRVEGAALARARKQAGVVGSLQMERRYAAFLRMEDKAELLTRLEQTLAFIEVKLRANTADRVRAAYDAAGVWCCRTRRVWATCALPRPCPWMPICCVRSWSRCAVPPTRRTLRV